MANDVAVTGCPCTLIQPCNTRCSCFVSFSSIGCSRCCTYGSLEQRRDTALELAKIIDESDALKAENGELLDICKTEHTAIVFELKRAEAAEAQTKVLREALEKIRNDIVRNDSAIDTDETYNTVYYALAATSPDESPMEEQTRWK